MEVCDARLARQPAYSGNGPFFVLGFSPVESRRSFRIVVRIHRKAPPNSALRRGVLVMVLRGQNMPLSYAYLPMASHAAVIPANGAAEPGVWITSKAASSFCFKYSGYL